MSENIAIVAKPGWKTTEFWCILIVQVINIWGAIKGTIPPEIAVSISAALQIVYTIMRTWIKKQSTIEPKWIFIQDKEGKVAMVKVQK